MTKDKRLFTFITIIIKKRGTEQVKKGKPVTRKKQHSGHKYPKRTILFGICTRHQAKMQLSLTSFSYPCSVDVNKLFTFFRRLYITTTQFDPFRTDNCYICPCCKVVASYFSYQRERRDIPIEPSSVHYYVLILHPISIYQSTDTVPLAANAFCTKIDANLIIKSISDWCFLLFFLLTLYQIKSLKIKNEY